MPAGAACVVIGTVMCALCCCFTIKMARSPRNIIMSSYDFSSARNLVRYRWGGSGRHSGCHRITHPAAQRQQNDHDGEDQLTHEVMIAGKK